MKTAVVTTSIRVPRMLEDVLQNALAFGHLDDVGIVCVGDRKSPLEAAEFLSTLEKRSGVPCLFVGTDWQEMLLRRWPALSQVLRWDSIQRRNIGFLMAKQSSAEVIISMDDDNVPLPEWDFVGLHSVVTRPMRLPLRASFTQWHNVCRLLADGECREFYHRGFPKGKVRWGGESWREHESTTHPVVNAGLWEGTPDVDATAHCESPLSVSWAKKGGAFALAPGTWSPFNTQNTSFDVCCLPAMWLPVMGDVVKGRPVQRFDDIWMSYFLRAIADQLGRSVSYGLPLVRQLRNPHNALHDLAGELAGYELTEWLVEVLREFSTDERSWDGAYEHLIAFLREASERDGALDRDYREYWRSVTIGMAVWLDVVRRL